jgi:hypothetical protein
MARDEDPAVAEEAVHAITGSRDPWFTAPLVELLGERRVRDGVRRALLERGDAALDVLARALVDRRTPVAVLRHIPRTIAHFGSAKAAKILVDSLAQIESGMVRFKLLRGLQTLLRVQRRRNGLHGAALAMSIDQRRIRTEFDRTLARSLELLETERLIAHAQRETPRFSTLGGELVVDLLRDKRELATGRLFMLLGLLNPDEDFQSILDAFVGDDGHDRASAQELIETLLSRDVASQILRLAKGLRGPIGLVPSELDPETLATRYEQALVSLLTDDSRSVRAVAMYHVGEVGLQPEVIEALERFDDQAPDDGTTTTDLRERALAALRSVRDGRRRPRLTTIAAT